jgi:hypothetical protein
MIVRLQVARLMRMVVRLACVISMFVMMQTTLVGAVSMRVSVLMKV